MLSPNNGNDNRPSRNWSISVNRSARGICPLIVVAVVLSLSFAPQSLHTLHHTINILDYKFNILCIIWTQTSFVSFRFNFFLPLHLFSCCYFYWTFFFLFFGFSWTVVLAILATIRSFFAFFCLFVLFVLFVSFSSCSFPSITLSKCIQSNN